MRVLVTGGTGFIGSHIVERLLDEGHAIVVAKRPSSSLKWLPVDKINFVDAPSENLEPLKKYLPEIDAVIHVAGITRANRRDDFFRVNASAITELLQICDKHAPKMKRFILISSLSAAGCSQNGCPIDETQCECPYTPYGESKRAGEIAALEYRDRFDVAILRPPAVYGPRETGVYAYFKLINRGFLPFIDNRKKKLSVIYVKDLAKATAMLLEADCKSGNAYFITDGEQHTWEEFGNRIAVVLNKKPLRLTIPSFLAWPVAAIAEGMARITGKPALLSFDRIRMFKAEWLCESAFLECDIGFEPEYNIENGIQEAAEWYRSEGWL